MTIVDLIQKILQNNPQGVYLNLVNQGLMLPGLTPSVTDIISVIEMNMGRPNNQTFLLTTFNVVVNTNGLYAQELLQMSNMNGKSIQMVLMDELDAENAKSPFETLTGPFTSTGGEAVPAWIVIFVAALALIGLTVLIRSMWKVIGKIIN